MNIKNSLKVRVRPLNYATVWFSRIKNLTRTQLLIYSYVYSNKFDTILTLNDWSELLGCHKRTVISAIKFLVDNKLISRVPNPSKYILKPRDLTTDESRILYEFYRKIK